MLPHLFKLRCLTYCNTFRSILCHSLMITSVQNEGNVRKYVPLLPSYRMAKELVKIFLEIEENILKVVNRNNLNILLNCYINKNNEHKLYTWRTSSDHFKQSEEISPANCLTSKTTEKFCKSAISQKHRKQYEKELKNNLDSKSSNSSEELKSKIIKSHSLVTPRIGEKQRDRLRSCVSFKFSVNSISWARIELPPIQHNVPCQLTNWHYHEIYDKKLHLSDLVLRCQHVSSMIPFGDCYVLESPQVIQAINNNGNIQRQNFNIQKAQIIAMISYALATRNSVLSTDKITIQNFENNVFYIRRLLAARLFKTLVGTERVSSELAIIEMMQTYNNTDDNISNEKSQLRENQKLHCNVEFPSEMRQIFTAAPRNQREFLGQALLLNLAFIRLILHEDQQSLQHISRYRKN